MAKEGVASVFRLPLSDEDKANLRGLEVFGRPVVRLIDEKFKGSGRPGIFIDCGFNTGIVTEYFIRELPQGFRFHGFELLEEECAAQVDTLRQHYPGLSLSVDFVAVSDTDGEVSFSKSGTDVECYPNWGSSIVPGKYDVDYSTSQPIKAIDFSGWLKRTFDEAAQGGQKPFIIVKMDIEGSEFGVLEKMIADETLGLMEALLIEWHDHQFPDEETQTTLRAKRERITEELQKTDVQVFEWH